MEDVFIEEETFPTIDNPRVSFPAELRGWSDIDRFITWKDRGNWDVHVHVRILTPLDGSRIQEEEKEYWGKKKFSLCFLDLSGLDFMMEKTLPESTVFIISEWMKKEFVRCPFFVQVLPPNVSTDPFNTPVRIFGHNPFPGPFAQHFGNEAWHLYRKMMEEIDMEWRTTFVVSQALNHDDLHTRFILTDLDADIHGYCPFGHTQEVTNKLKLSVRRINQVPVMETFFLPNTPVGWNTSVPEKSTWLRWIQDCMGAYYLRASLFTTE